ncbi:hypothetical protein BC827DRAFT_1268493 [Russula dissimulans]|nr:hypothetical protein BC827DRAFT_1268493 [Russula dissimulans]
MSPHFLDLSAELVIEILAYGSLRDIGACAQTSRRLYDIISGSLYMRYLVRTKVAGVCDPFVPGLSIQERISALERWERAWHGLDLRQPVLQCVVPGSIAVSILRYEIHDGYLIGTRQFPTDDRPLGYNYFDLHDAVKSGHVSWTNVDLHRSLSVFSYCFHVAEHNLAVMLVYDREENPEPGASLRVMDFHKGTDHPLATAPNIQLQFGGKNANISDAYNAHMEVAGENVVVMITQARALSDYVFLVGWKSGKVSLILTAPDLMYAASFSLINSELLALVNLQTNTLDIHRIHDGASCALQRVGGLSLPFPRTGIPLLSASLRLARARFPTCPSSSRPQTRRCLPFYPSPDACLLGLTVIVTAQDDTTTFHWLAIRPDSFSSVAETKCDDSGSDRRPTPWETWSPHAACCVEIEHLLAAPTPAGARWLVHSEPLSVRELGRSRSPRMQADQRAHHDQAVGGNPHVLVRHALEDSFPSQLPYHDTPVSMGERKYESVIADYEWVVGMNHEGEDFLRTTHHLDIHHVV